MKLSVIIVNWNVKALLARCLATLDFLKSRKDAEVYVVDNASQDGSVSMITEKYPHVKCIANEENRGFGTANNQAILRTNSEYVLFLNPDAQIDETALSTMTDYLDTHQDVGVVAPKILNEDGSLQSSLRRFPTFWSQVFILTKLAKLFPQLSFLQHHEGVDLDPEKEQLVEQPMGACFLVRRSVLNRVGIFDERFFLWYEEVDLLKRIRDAGYGIMYLPNAKITHVRGTSFAKMPLARKQRILFTSCEVYMKKHCGVLAALGVRILSWGGIPAATCAQFLRANPLFGVTLGGIALAEIFSLLGYFYDPIWSVGFVAWTAFALGITLWKAEYGIGILVAELIIGSKGHLFGWGISDSQDIGVRIGIFAAVLIAWGIQLARRIQRDGAKHTLVDIENHFPFWKAYCVVIAMVLYGTIVGLLEKNSIATVFSDANAWGYWLLVPVVFDVIRTKEQVRTLSAIATAACAAMIAKTFFVLYFMSHQAFGDVLRFHFYRWIRETGIGEVTLFQDQWYRVFFQSHIYLLPIIGLGIFALIASYLTAKKRPAGVGSPWGWIMAGFSAVVGIFLISLSRSLWIAGAVSILGVVAYVVAKKPPALKVLLRMIRDGMLAGIIGVLLLAGAVAFPFPPASSSLGLSFFSDRLNNWGTEAAAITRWQMLPVLMEGIAKSPLLGSGFGKTLTYASQDPRVLERNEGGNYTTYTFEWGYLDFVLKIGVLGALALIAFFVGMWLSWGKKFLSFAPLSSEWIIGGGLLFGYTALLVTHIFTPYLNHPLGIGYILAVWLWFGRAMATNK